MDNRFVSKRILLSYAIVLIIGTYFAASGVDYLINVLVGAVFHMPYAYANSAICILAGFVLVGAGHGLYQVYLEMIQDKMHEAHCTIRELHKLPRICDSYVGISLIFITVLMELAYRILHFMDAEIIIVLHDPFKLFFGPLLLGIYGIFLVYRGNRNRKK